MNCTSGPETTRRRRALPPTALSRPTGRRPAGSPRRQNPALLGSLIFCLTLAGCGGGGGDTRTGSPGDTGAVTPAPNPAPTPPSGVCSLRSRQDWAATQLREWYLFPESLPANLDPTPYRTVDDYIDALTATARAEGKDRYFTYITSIAEENAYFSSGRTAAFGFRLGLDSNTRRLVVTDSYESAPALTGGIDRGAEIIAIGNSIDSLRTVESLLAGGTSALSNAFGPDTVGTSRAFQVRDASGTRVVTLTKADFAIEPVSPRFGARTLTVEGQRIGYINLRTFIETSEEQLRKSFDSFRSQGIDQVIVDFRYNGGGLVRTSEVMADLLGGNRLASDVVSYVTYRPSKSGENRTRLFRRQPEAISPLKVAFIATQSTASASENVINTFAPYLRTNAILVGSDTFGKPVGQVAVDRAECDDRLRIVAFAVQNSERKGDYYTGLAKTVPASCSASDAIDQQMGDPREASTRAAIDALAGRSCTAIGAAAATASATAQRLGSPVRRTMLVPERPSTAQREVPGTF